MTHRSKLLCGLTAAISMSVVAVAATAHVDKSYSASACQPFRGTGDGWRDLDGSILNKSTAATGDYVCPVIHEFTGGFIQRVRVKVFDRHSSENVYCHVYSRKASGDAAGWAGKGTTGFSSAAKELVLDTVAWGDGSSVLRCTVPRNHTTNGASGVLNYQSI